MDKSAVLSTKRITIWSILKENGDKIHNHIENDWVDGDFPLPFKKEFTNQLSWKNMKWKKRHAYLVDGKVVELYGGYVW